MTDHLAVHLAEIGRLSDKVARLERAIRAEIEWNGYEAKIHRNAEYLAIAEAHEEAANRLAAILTVTDLKQVLRDSIEAGKR